MSHIPFPPAAWSSGIPRSKGTEGRDLCNRHRAGFACPWCNPWARNAFWVPNPYSLGVAQLQSLGLHLLGQEETLLLGEVPNLSQGGGHTAAVSSGGGGLYSVRRLVIWNSLFRTELL